jgi:predicted DNA-binding protein
MKATVNIPEPQAQTIEAIADRLGITSEDLIQQIVDKGIEDMDTWLQRAETILH